ncbi:hypothetical protein [Kistimonas asteriae]|uniref:hypothetical protein n=1 Tax=Kistimonas asteriae TaxID=517724 RepID=UPI001BA4F379|nr:hypothetical protein [Kistimonas asteriae]
MMKANPNLAEQEQVLHQTRLDFMSTGADPDSPGLIDRYLDQAITLADILQQSGKRFQQEALLFSVFNDLLNAIADPLRPRVFRTNCLDRLYRPLVSLNHFYGSHPRGKASLRKLHWEMQLVSHYFSP